MAFNMFCRARHAKAKALVSSMLAWSLLHMLVYSTRIAAPSLTFGLAAAMIVRDQALFRAKPRKANQKIPRALDPRRKPPKDYEGSP